jgi:SAM-dependent methyltransferase
VPALRPEHQLLLYCSRTDIDAEITENIRQLATPDLNWDFLFLAASQHGLLGLLHHRLQRICPESVPDWAMEFLRDCSRRTAERNRYLTEELLRILKRFRDRQIAAVPFAGPILAAVAYGDLSLRESKSLSFLISAKQLTQAKELLLEDGYRREYTWDQQREAAEWRFLRVIGFDREDGVHVWLYRDIDPGCFVPVVDLNFVQDKLASFSFNTESIASLSAEDLLLHICAEAAEMALSPRLWRIVDIAQLLDKQTGTDWSHLVQRSCSVGARRRLGMGLLLARDLLGARIPDPLEAIVHGDQTAATLASDSAAGIFSERDIVPRMGTRLAARIKSRERLRDKGRVLIRFAMTPTRDDWALLPLPTSLYFLWKPIRILARRAHLVSSRRLAVFMPTPIEVAQQMLNLAEVGPADTVFDLGCGDGRIVILAARERGARGVGVDLDPDRVAEAQANARKAGVEHLVSFARRDVMDMDLSTASVVSLFLSPQANLMLRPKLQRQLPDNARIVSRSHDMGDWLPLKTKLVACDGALSRIHLWRIERQIQTKPADDAASQQ